MSDRAPAAVQLDSPARYNLRYVWTISAVAAMGGLLFGHLWVVIGGAKPFFERFFNLTSGTQSGWANSCALLGCLLGSLVTGALSDRFGRKRLLWISALLFAVSSVLTGWAGSFTSFVVWRILGGVAIGMASNLSPMYIAEVSPAHLRGRLVAVNQLTIVIGILGAQIANWWLAVNLPHLAAGPAAAGIARLAWNIQFGWRWMFSAVAVPAALFLVGASLVPESPRWLVKNGRTERARAILARIGWIKSSSVASLRFCKKNHAAVVFAYCWGKAEWPPSRSTWNEGCPTISPARCSWVRTCTVPTPKG